MENIKNAHALYKAFSKNSFIIEKVLKCIIYFFVFTIITASLILVEPKGSEDYCCSLILIPMAFGTLTIAETVSYKITNSRFFFSTPYAKEIMTRVKPFISLLRSVILSLVSVVTLLVLNVAGLSEIGLTEIGCMSDLLIFCSIGVFISLITSGLSTLWSALAGVYIFGGGCIITGFLQDVSFIAGFIKNGFGLPMYASVLILMLSFIIGELLSLKISEKTYKTRSTKYMNALAAYAQLNK